MTSPPYLLQNPPNPMHMLKYPLCQIITLYLYVPVLQNSPNPIQFSNQISYPHSKLNDAAPLFDLLVAASHGVPKPTLPSFTSGTAKDFASLHMALDSIVNVHSHISEQYKFQLLLDKLGGSAHKLAQAYMHDSQPYTMALYALKDKYGQSRQLVQSEISTIMTMNSH